MRFPGLDSNIHGISKVYT